MKKWLYAAGLGLAMAAAGAQANIAVVNINEVFQAMPEKEAVTKQLEKEFAPRITELQKMEKALKSDIDKLQANAAKMKKDDLKGVEQALNVRQMDFAKKAEAFEQENRQRQMEERNKMLAKIQKAVTEVAKQDKYTVVIDVNTIAYAEPSVNITAKVIEQVKK